MEFMAWALISVPFLVYLNSEIMKNRLTGMRRYNKELNKKVRELENTNFLFAEIINLVFFQKNDSTFFLLEKKAISNLEDIVSLLKTQHGIIQKIEKEEEITYSLNVYNQGFKTLIIGVKNN